MMNTIVLIETIRVINQKIPLKEYHFFRLIESFKIVQIPISSDEIHQQIISILNNANAKMHSKSYRLRIEISIEKGFIQHSENLNVKWNFSVQPLNDTSFTWNSNGLKMTAYEQAYKKSDNYSNLKSSNREIYRNALQFAQTVEMDDAFVFNENDYLADASIYNVFIIKNKKIYTPPLSDAPIAGVMRNYILKNLKHFYFEKQSITEKDILEADEVFLTNAVRGIQYVQSYREKQYPSHQTQLVFEAFMQSI
jgi:branched-chain amino acid aminotransferase